MKKYLSLLGVLILFAQPAFSQCGPGGCPVNRQAYQPMQQVMQQPVQQSGQYYLQSYQPQQFGQQIGAASCCPQINQCGQPVGAAACCPPQAVQCNPNFAICPNLSLGMTGAASNLQASYCKCPQLKSGWRTFVEDYLGFD